MRRSSVKTAPLRGLPDRPAVSVVADGVTDAGRKLVRGIIRYARNNTKWILRLETNPHRVREESWDRENAIIYASATGTLLQHAMEHKLAVVDCMAHHEDIVPVTVRADDFAIGEMAAAYFMERGFKHYVFFSGYDRFRAAQLRFAGFCKRLASEKLTATWFDPANTHGKETPIQLIDFVRQGSKPMAVFFGHDALARHAADELMAGGVKIPQEAALLGVDNDELDCEISDPPLSSIEAPYVDIGYRAAALLDQVLRGQLSGPHRQTVMPIGVVTRMSTDTFVLRDPRVAEALNYIREHACRPCSVEDVANAVCVSRRWLETEFKRQCNRSPMAEITRVRVERSKQLMTDAEMSLKAIAQRSGYQYLQNFISIFRRHTGQTPAAYRRAMRRVTGVRQSH